MNFDQYQVDAARTAKRFQHLAGDLNHACLGMITEYFELLGTTTVEHAEEEIGDFFWYVALAATAMDLPLQTVMGTNDINTFQVGDALEKGNEPRHGFELALGRFTTMVKRLAIYEKPLTEEMKRGAFFDLRIMSVKMAVICDQRGVALRTALRLNIEKLRKRFPDKYSDEAAEARADKGGLDATVS